MGANHYVNIGWAQTQFGKLCNDILLILRRRCPGGISRRLAPVGWGRGFNLGLNIRQSYFSPCLPLRVWDAQRSRRLGTPGGAQQHQNGQHIRQH
jgi:hypothetical protein